MLKAWRDEFLCLLAAGLVLLSLGMVVGHTGMLLGAGLAAYFGWHLLNLFLLYRWVVSSRRFRPPVSLGVWEAVFDGLQRRQLGNRRRRRNLVEQVRQLRDGGERLPDALVLLDADHCVLWFNKSAKRLLGLRRQEDLGREITEIVQYPALQDMLAGIGSSRQLEIASPANGAWMLSVQTSGYFGPERRCVLIARDITASYRIEEVRRDFVANVSHELRTPITVFRGYLAAMRDDADLSRWEIPLASMNEQAQRMQDLVNDLLLLSRLEMTRPAQPVDLVAVPAMLESIVTQARALSGTKGHDISLDSDPDLLLFGREDELHSAFSNLVVNAVRHTPPETRIAISWAGTPDGACLTVQDFGPGIAASHLPRLTERFYRVDSSRSRKDGGTGLGLAIVKHVLERHDAEFRIASEPGRGSVFSCHFPEELVNIYRTKIRTRKNA